MWDVILDAVLDTLKLFPFLLLLYILIELMEHNTRLGRANRALSGRWAPLLGGATGLIPMCGFSVMAAKLYEKRYVTLGTLLAVFIATSDEAFLVMIVSEMSWLDKLVSILSMCGIKLALGAGIGYAVDLIGRRRGAQLVPMPAEHTEAEGHVCDGAHMHEEAEEHVCDGAHMYEETGGHVCGGAHMHEEAEGHAHGHGGEEEFTACEHKHGKRGNLSLYLVSPLLHSLKVAAFVLLVNLLFGFLFYFVGEERVIDFLQGSGYWYQPLICALLGFVPNCASSVIIAEVYAMGGIAFGSCLAGLIVNTGLGYLILFKNVSKWKRTLCICAFMIALGIAIGYAVNAVSLALPAISL